MEAERSHELEICTESGVPVRIEISGVRPPVSPLSSSRRRRAKSADGPPIVEIAQPSLPSSAPIGDGILEGLNEQQRRVVRAVEGPILCIAGAGSGKTMTLTHRCAYLIDQGIPPGQILLLTFTRAAASSMLRRVRSLTPRAEALVGGTFHSVAAQVLRQAHAMFDLPRNFTILDPDDCRSVVKECLGGMSLPRKSNIPRASTFYKWVSYSANTRTPIAEVIEILGENYIHLQSEAEELRKRYVAYKIERGLLDFDDLLIYFGLLLQNPGAQATLRKRYRYVMVDEHQDSNALQLDIVYGLGGDKPNLLVVGDPAQAIYGFRGSAPETLLGFTDRYREARVLPLEINYRSTQPILDLANRVDLAMRPRFERKLAASRWGKAELPQIVVCGTPRHEAKEICARILLAKEEGIELAEQAVLFRSMWVARRLETELIARKIPYVVVGGLRIDEAAHIKDFLSLARVVENPRNHPAWMRLLTRLPRVGDVWATRILAELENAKEIDEALEMLAKATFPAGAHRKPLTDSLQRIAAAGDLVERLRQGVEAFEPVLETVYKEEWEAYRKRDVETVLDLVPEYDSLSDFLAGLTIDYSIDKVARRKGSEREEEKPLTLSTVHSAKGLEWKIVHIPTFTSSHMPSRYALTEKEIAEELRIFYVAVTRAADRLYFYRPTFWDEAGSTLAIPSEYEDLVEELLVEVGAIEPLGEADRPIEFEGKIDLRENLL